MSESPIPAWPKEAGFSALKRALRHAPGIYRNVETRKLRSEEDILKIALVHDWFLGVGGAENVVKELHHIFPDAPIYALFYDERFVIKFLPKADIRPSFLQKYFNKPGTHKWLIPLMPAAVESLDLSEFDLVISSSAYFSKGLILHSHTRHICYCHSPTRQFWDWHAEYRREVKSPAWLVSLMQHTLRIWDRHASLRVDKFIANSENVRRRIIKYYGRDTDVIYPPVLRRLASQGPGTGCVKVGRNQPPYFLIVSRLFKHKNIEIAVRAFNKLGWSLVIVGEGPERKKLQKIAAPNIKFTGFVPDERLGYYYLNSLAFIMPQEEDFGITPIEAMHYGKPVLALRRGGALEYVEPGVNGEFFADSHPDVLAYHAMLMKKNIKNYNSEKIKKTAERFSRERFKKEILYNLQLVLEK